MTLGRRSLATLLLTNAALLASCPMTGSAAALAGSDPVSLSQVSVTGRELSAVLTVRGQPTAGPVTATIGGQRVPVTMVPIRAGRRSAVLVVDTSGSMGPSGMAAIVRATGAFLASVPSDVEVGIVAFADSPVVLVRPTRDRALVARAVTRLRAAGKTTLYDGIALALAQLGTTGERSLVVLSDGGDSGSRHTLTATTVALTSSRVQTQIVGFKTNGTQTAVLARLAAAGHGRVVAVDNVAALSRSFGEAALAFASQTRVRVTAPSGLAGAQPLIVTVGTDKAAITAQAVVTVAGPTPSPAAAPVPDPSPTAPDARPEVATASPTSLPWTVWAAVAATFLGLGAAVLFAFGPRMESWRTRRVREVTAYLDGSGAVTAGGQQASTGASSLTSSLTDLGDRVTAGRKSTAKTAVLLERADLPLRAGEWAVLRAIAVVVGVAIGVVLLHGSGLAVLAGLIAGTALGLAAPVVFLRFAAKSRAKKFERQLPDVLTLVASSLSTGFSLLQAIDAVARDAAEPSAKEFSRALAETRIGAEIADSLDRIADRMDSTNLRWTSMAIRIQRQVGGNLGETLRTTATTLRDRESLQRHVRGLSAEGRLSAYILIALPIGVFLYMMMANRPYISLLWTSLLGLGMLVGACVSLVIGVLWMQKVVKVEV